MANGASRLFKLMQNSGTDTISEVVYLTITSTSPLIFNLENRFDITDDFYILSDDIVKSKLSVGDKVLAFTFNSGQCYFIQQALDKNVKLTSVLQQEIEQLKARVTALENAQ